MRYDISTRDGQDTAVTVFTDSGSVLTATPEHANFPRIVDYLRKGGSNARKLAELFDIGVAISNGFAQLTDRVAVRGRQLLFDGDPMNDILAATIVRYYTEGNEDFGPLALFAEKLAANPVPASRDELFRWLQHNSFYICEDGDFVGYKGVIRTTSGFLSSSSGHAFVNGTEFNFTQIPTHPGVVVEMPRSEVEHNPHKACSAGLHVGTFSYAKGFGNTRVAVKVNPLDVVSVPHEGRGEKMRVRRYRVLDVVTSIPEDMGLLVRDVESRTVTLRSLPKPGKRTMVKGGPLPAPDPTTASTSPVLPPASNKVGKLVESAKAVLAAEPPAKRPARVVAKKAPAKKAPAKKAPAKKAPAKKAPAKKAPANGNRTITRDHKTGAPKKSKSRTSVTKAAPEKVTPSALKKRGGAIKTPVRFYEDFRTADFSPESFVSLRWLAKEWGLKLGSNPNRTDLVKALAAEAAKRRAKVARGTVEATTTR